MDLFKKGTLKSQSLNSRFLASNSPPTQTRSHPVQLAKTHAPTPSPSGPLQNSKLKLTTLRQSSSLRITRDQASSPSVNDQSPGIPSTSFAERKAPVWNKGVVPPKNSKEYTDEELKAMHGISLVSRKSNTASGTKEGRWDDSDEDDDWGDTIDFGDGTKVTIGQTQTTNETNVVQDSPQVPEIQVPDSVEAPPVPEFQAPPLIPEYQARPVGNPWRTTDAPVSNTVPTDEFPSVGVVPPLPMQRAHRPPSFEIDNRPYANRDSMSAKMRSPTQEFGYEQRARSGSFNRDGRMQQSGDARYQYEQNTYDRHWQNPPPQTREIYNSTTGRFEQIDASHKPGRRPSHHERKSTDVLQRPQLMSGDARRESNNAVSPVTAGRQASVAQSAVSTTNDVPGGQPNGVHAPGVTKASSPILPVNVPAPIKEEVLDPSSPQFIEMQKKLMAERRERAIQRRKEQEAEELARKERARKKAEELVALTEKEKLAEKASQIAKQETSRSMQQPKIVTRRPADLVESNISAQKATRAAIINEQTKRISRETKTATSDEAMWDRGAAGPTANNNTPRSQLDTTKTKFDRQDPFDELISSPPSRDKIQKLDDSNEQASNSRNVWGPIGTKNSSSANLSSTTPILGTFGLDNDLGASNANGSVPPSPQTASRTREQIASPSWSAFDSIAQPRRIAQKPLEAREYNVFDAADEVITPEKHRYSPAGQSQANRTSSRFFPTPSAPIAPKSKTVVPFVSPELPPQADSDMSLHYEPEGTAPALLLPEASINITPGRKGSGHRSIDQIIASIRSDAHVGSSHARHGGRPWLDTQTRSVWEIKPMRDGHSPRVKIPYSEKPLDWSRKEKAVVVESKPAVTLVEKPMIPSGLPAEPAWTLPKNLETTSKVSSIAEPLLPPKPALKLPEQSEDAVMSPLQGTKRKHNRYEQDRVNKYYTTRPSLVEELDNMTPIRIKTTDAETTIPRKFGKRVEIPQKKIADVKRQPVNMSDAPGGSGFKRGFANRTKVTTPTVPATPPGATKEAQNGQSMVARGSPVQKNNPMERTPKVTIAQRPRESPGAVENHIHHPQPSAALPRQASHPPPQGSPQIPSPVQYMQHPALPQNPSSQSPMVPRVAPPGLAAPMNILSPDHGSGVGHISAQVPTPAARGPPGIVLP